MTSPAAGIPIIQTNFLTFQTLSKGGGNMFENLSKKVLIKVKYNQEMINNNKNWDK